MDGKSHMAKPQAASWPRSHRRSSGSGSGLDGDPCRHIQGGATPPGPRKALGIVAWTLGSGGLKRATMAGSMGRCRWLQGGVIIGARRGQKVAKP